MPISEIRVLNLMKKIFKFILNTIPRPILIRLSIVVRPIIAFLLKGSAFTDPIDGKSFQMFCLTDMAINEITYCLLAHYP